jgi:hypothetical protein
MHQHVNNCLIPQAGDELDPAGQALRAVEAAIDNLCELPSVRFYGDANRIADAADKLVRFIGYEDVEHLI